jgi:hypothetical protein
VSLTDVTTVIGQNLLACLTVAVQAQAAAGNAPVPARIGFLVGATAVEDLSVYDDMCCDGTAYVRFASAYPSANFPQPDQGDRNCDPIAWGTIWEVGIMRCAPVGTANFITDMPTWAATNAIQMSDNNALEVTSTSYKQIYATGANDAGVLVGQVTPLGPQGKCVSLSMSITIQAIGC